MSSDKMFIKGNIWLLLLLICFVENIQSQNLHSQKIGSVLVTGADRGIGLEYVRQFAYLEDAPDYIFATYRNESTLKNLIKIKESARNSEIILLKMDVRDLEQIEEAKDQIEEIVGDRGLNLLINNAGVLEVQPFPHISYKSMEYHFGTNTVGPILVTQAMLPLLNAAARHSHIEGKNVQKAAVISMSDIIGSIQYTGEENLLDLSAPAYKISKAGLNMGMRIVAAEVKDYDILVVNVEPGWVKTKIGGPDALQTPEETVHDLIKTFYKLDDSYHGAYINRFGENNPF